MKNAYQRSLPLALLALGAHAQQMPGPVTIVNNPNDPGVTTVTYSVCPTLSASTTITNDVTQTYCPGPYCNGGPEHTETHDGSVTVYRTHYTQVCPTGFKDVEYTVTEDCPCTANRPSNYIPSGFTTEVVTCTVCGDKPVTTTLTVPISTGPYASAGASATGGAGGSGAAAGTGAGSFGASGTGASTGTGAGSPGASGMGASTGTGAGSPGASGTGAAAGGSGATGATPTGASNGTAGIPAGAPGSNPQAAAGSPGASGAAGSSAARYNGSGTPSSASRIDSLATLLLLGAVSIGGLAWAL